MTTNTISDTKVNKRDIIFIFIILYVSNSMYTMEQVRGNIRIFSALAVTLVFLLVKRYYTNISMHAIITFSALMCIKTLTMIIYGTNIELDFSVIINMIIAFIIVSSISFNDFSLAFRKIMIFTSFFSLVTFFLYPIVPSLFRILPQHLWHNNIYFYNLAFSIIPSSLDIYRNFGFFREPGMYQIYINYALYLELFVIDKKNTKVILLYILTLATTLSANGYVVGVLLLLVYITNMKTKSRKIAMKKIKIIIPVVIIGIAIVDFVFSNDFSKFSYISEKFSELGGEAKGGGSGAERWRAFIYAWNAYLQNPILGMGISNFVINFKGIIMTATPLNWFATYGTIYGVLCNYLYIYQVKGVKKNFLGKLIVAIALELMLISQEVSSHFLIFSMIFYSAAMIDNADYNKKESAELSYQLKC